MDSPIPASRIYITVAGNRYALVPTDKLLSPELRELKRVSGLALAPFTKAIEDADWDAWFAWIYISMRRERANLTEAQLENEIGDTPPVAVIGSVEEETPEVAATDPLDNGDESSASESTQNGNGSGATIPPLSTSDPSGHRT